MDDRAMRPAGSDKVAPSYGFTRMCEKPSEQPELEGSQRSCLFSCGDRVRQRIQRQPPGFESSIGAGPPQKRTQSGKELLERERLRQVVVAARCEAGEPVGERIARGEEQHGRGDSARAKRLA